MSALYVDKKTRSRTPKIGCTSDKGSMPFREPTTKRRHYRHYSKIAMALVEGVPIEPEVQQPQIAHRCQATQRDGHMVLGASLDAGARDLLSCTKVFGFPLYSWRALC